MFQSSEDRGKLYLRDTLRLPTKGLCPLHAPFFISPLRDTSDMPQFRSGRIEIRDERSIIGPQTPGNPDSASALHPHVRSLLGLTLLEVVRGVTRR